MASIYSGFTDLYLQLIILEFQAHTFNDLFEISTWMLHRHLKFSMSHMELLTHHSSPRKKKSISPTVFHISANGTTIQPAVKAKSKNHPDTSLILISYLIHHQALSNIPKKYITFISLQLYCYHPVQATIISQHYYCIISISCICST